MKPTDLVTGLPDHWQPVEPYPGIFRLETPREKSETVEGLKLPGLKRFLALYRNDPWFLRPAWGGAEADLPEKECQMLLWQRTDGQWGVLLPTSHGNRRAWLQRGEKGITLHVRGVRHENEPETLCLLLAGVGSNPAELIQNVIRAGMDRLRTARPHETKPAPEWVDLFGWCTWDAFYNEVTLEKVGEGLEAFQKDALPIPLLIVDDGWQQWRDAQLLCFEPDPVKFPGGIPALSQLVKEMYGVKLLGVWHALMGYWNGLHPEGELASRFQLCPSYHGAYNIAGSDTLKRSLIHPDDVARFYQEFHAYLRREGVDMVKVDNQASLDHFTQDIVPDYLATEAFQNAIQGSAATHFANNLLHCMAMSTDIAWHLGNSAVWRNSQDYYPKQPESHGIHLVANAANALWSSAFALPDWDMFHSGGGEGWFHGAARAISGGPVYISDTPGNHDAQLIRALTLSGGRVPRPPEPARVADSRILVDCVEEERLLLVRNRTAAGFLLGVFHCGKSEKKIADTWSPAEAGAAGRVAVQGFQSGSCCVMDATDAVGIELPPRGWEIFTIVPIVDGLAPFGLAEKLAGAAAITRWENLGDGAFCAKMLDGGALKIWSEGGLMVRDSEGEKLLAENDGSGLWTVKVPLGAQATLFVKKT